MATDLMDKTDQISAPPASLPHIRIEPTQGWVALQLRELWRYRELLYFLTWRDIKVRYKQTGHLFGVRWYGIQEPRAWGWQGS